MSDSLSQRPSIRLRRTPSSSFSTSQLVPEQLQQLQQQQQQTVDNGTLQVPGVGSAPRRRPHALSSPPRLAPRQADHMPRLDEAPTPTTTTAPSQADELLPSTSEAPINKPLPDLPPGEQPSDGSQEYESNLVDLLDLIDPEVQTLSTLTNVQNSLFVPDLGRFVNRRPSYTLTKYPSDPSLKTSSSDETPTEPEQPSDLQRTPTSYTLASITSRQTEQHYAVLPHGVKLKGWNAEDRRQLDDHVRHMLHSRRSRFKRRMKGFGQYVRRPLGFFITLYAVLITLFGLAWVLFLIGWVNVGGRKYYIINVIDNVLVALFAIMGDGLAPFRAVDTYHMIFIAHYHHLTWRLRREQNLPKLQDRNDLPPLPPVADPNCDLEAGTAVANPGAPTKHDDNGFCPNKDQFSVLTPKQQRRLVYHQMKFAKSHTFYKPHETETHHAFPLRLLVAIVVLLDCHSLLQISLGATTWSISYHVRPFALTTVILCCSITVNITAGILISVGDHKTRKKDVMERMHRQELTAEAIRKLEKEKQKRLKKAAAHGIGSDLSPMTHEEIEEQEEKTMEEGLEQGLQSSLPTIRTTLPPP